MFKVFNQDFIVDERYNVTKELGQGAYGIVWYVVHLSFFFKQNNIVSHAVKSILSVYLALFFSSRLD